LTPVQAKSDLISKTKYKQKGWVYGSSGQACAYHEWNTIHPQHVLFLKKTQ
jgi:hypothetical protein